MIHTVIKRKVIATSSQVLSRDQIKKKFLKDKKGFPFHAGHNVQFNPILISGLKLWLDATQNVFSDAGITPAVNGNGVQQWGDRSGNGNNVTQGTAASRPTFTTAQLNGLPTINFDGVNDFMRATSFTLAQPEHIFIVFKNTTYTVQGRIFDGNTVNSMLVYNNNPTPQFQMFDGSGACTIATVPVGTFAVCDFLFSGSSSFSRANNSVKNTGSIGTDSGSGITLGATFDGSSNWGNVAIAEILVYNTALSDANAALVTRYLGAKWNVAVN